MGIPVIVHAEALCGGVVAGMTQYPSPIGLGASFMPDNPGGKLSVDIPRSTGQTPYIIINKTEAVVTARCMD